MGKDQGVLHTSPPHCKSIRIGCWSGFWGDTSTGAHQLVKQGGKMDYLVGDYLSEITMGILARSKTKSEQDVKGGMGAGGYIAEFVNSVWIPLLPLIVKKKIKVITNAGGMNPLSLKKHLEEASIKAGFNIKVGAVFGDDLTNTPDLSLKPFTMIQEEKFPKDKKFMSVNAYLGAFPIVKCLEQGADVIVTGRCVDSALVLAPLIHEFGWKREDYNLLASGSLAGHIIECGCQCTGGNFTDWQDSYPWDNVGFPIVDCFSDGSFLVTKPQNTGGLVSVGTVCEQMVYEINDPKNYILPDVILDFSQVTVTQVQKNIVLVKGAQGRAPTSTFKVSLTWMDGYMLSASILIGGIDAVKKAKAVSHGILQKTSRILPMLGLKDFDDVNIEFIGSEHTYGPHSRMLHSREVTLRMTVCHSNPKALGLFAKELAPSATAMAPGITGSGGGRPKVSPKMMYASCLIDKNLIPVSVSVGSDFESTEVIVIKQVENVVPMEVKISTCNHKGYMMSVPLVSLCWARSGDKGDSSNIGVIVRKQEYYEHVVEYLTQERVFEYMSHLVKGQVVRYLIPGIFAMNFVCTSSLDMLNVDRQGKAYAQMLLDMPIPVPLEWISRLESKL